MSQEWETQYNEVSIAYDNQLIRVKTDEALLRYLSEPEVGSVKLANYIRDRYFALYQKELAISSKSLAVEILIHCYLDVFLHRTEALGQKLPDGVGNKLNQLLHSLSSRTEVIDCGERAVDPNRVVFDSLSPFCGILCAMLGKKA